MSQFNLVDILQLIFGSLALVVAGFIFGAQVVWRHVNRTKRQARDLEQRYFIDKKHLH